MLTFLPLLTVRGDDDLAPTLTEALKPRRDEFGTQLDGPIMPDCYHREADEIERNDRRSTILIIVLALAFLGAVFAALPECSAENERANETSEVGR